MKTLAHRGGSSDGVTAGEPAGWSIGARIAGVAAADVLVVPMIGMASQAAADGAGEVAAVVLSGPLTSLVLAQTRGYDVRVLAVWTRSLVALGVTLLLVVASVSGLRAIEAPQGASPWAPAVAWLTVAFSVLAGFRWLVASALSRSPARTAQPVLVVADESEPASSLAAAVEHPFPRRVLFLSEASDWGAKIREEVSAVEPAQVVVTTALLWGASLDPTRYRRNVDALSSLPCPVRLALPGGSREPKILVPLVERPLGPLDRALKRALDLTLAGSILMFVAPLLVVIALLIKLDSRGPVLFRQPRLGLAGRVFEIYKFRTMHTDAADLGGRRLTVRGDPRVTRVGAFLRRSSLDELPQLLNVLKGDMSLVGPRPHPLEALAGGRPYTDVVPDIARRLAVPPGVTGLAQIEGWRGNTLTERDLVERVRLDLAYIQQWSIWLDLEIILRTPLAILTARNAY